MTAIWIEERPRRSPWLSTSKADLVLMDERRGRVIADRFGLKVVGVLGILIEAKARGLLPAVGPVLDALLTVANFRVGPTLYLYLHVLRAAEE